MFHGKEFHLSDLFHLASLVFNKEMNECEGIREKIQQLFSSFHFRVTLNVLFGQTNVLFGLVW